MTAVESWAVFGAVILMAAVLGLIFLDPYTKPQGPEIDTAVPQPDMAQLDDEEGQA